MTSSRRTFLKSAGLGGVGLGVTAGAATVVSRGDRAAASVAATGATPPPADNAGTTVPFYGAHQGGIATPTQNDLQFAALDMVSNSLADLRTLLRTWSDAAARMAKGELIGSVRTGHRPPADTGEAVGLPPSRLTVTFGFGPTLFDSNGQDRFGLRSRRPGPLVHLPAFLGDALQPQISAGDLAIQVCADNPQVAFHAMHELVRLAIGIASPRWLIAGAGRTANSRHQPLPRNLMGFQDGTENIKVEDAAALKKFAWASEPTSPAWMRGGSYLVARRIEINLKLWDSTGLSGQQDTIGRDKLGGGVLGHVPPTAHILLASPERNHGQRLLRRGYNYFDGIDPLTGGMGAGLMFLCYQRDPRRQFIPIQRRIAGIDALSLYLTHVGSAIFACPPGASPGGYVGEHLLG
jgi:deferrochelatase/peroxidase EfeB